MTKRVTGRTPYKTAYEMALSTPVVKPKSTPVANSVPTEIRETFEHTFDKMRQRGTDGARSTVTPQTLPSASYERFAQLADQQLPQYQSIPANEQADDSNKHNDEPSEEIDDESTPVKLAIQDDKDKDQESSSGDGQDSGNHGKGAEAQVPCLFTAIGGGADVAGSSVVNSGHLDIEKITALIEQHVDRLLLSDPAHLGTLGSQAVILLKDSFLTNATLTLTRVANGWSLKVEGLSSDAIRKFRRHEGHLAERFSQRGLDPIKIEWP